MLLRSLKIGLVYYHTNCGRFNLNLSSGSSLISTFRVHATNLFLQFFKFLDGNSQVVVSFGVNIFLPKFVNHEVPINNFDLKSI